LIASRKVNTPSLALITSALLLTTKFSFDVIKLLLKVDTKNKKYKKILHAIN
jgi:hypothetical protein